MRNKWFILLCVILCFVLSACGAETPPETEPSPDANEVTETSEPNANGVIEPPEWDPNLTLPAREDVLAVDIGVMPESYGLFSTGTNDIEREAILDILYGAELNNFEITDELYQGASNGSFLLRTADKTVEVNFVLVRVANLQYLEIISDGRRIVKKGSTDTFDADALDELNSQIKMNTDDPLYSGSVENAATGEVTNKNKLQTAYARGYLEQALAKAEISSDESVSYDTLFALGEVTYGINTETGHCYRLKDGEKTYAQLDSNQLMMLLSRLNTGVPLPFPPQ